jgi:signal transduction histidine kinase
MAENPQNSQNTAQDSNTSIGSLMQGTPDDAAKMLHNVAEELYTKNLQLYREETRLSEILVQIAEIIIAVDQDYKITMFNLSAEQVFNTGQKDALGKHIDEVVKIYKGLTVEPLKVTEYAFRDEIKIVEHVSIIIDDGENPADNELDRMYFNLKSTYVDYKNDKKEAVIVLSNITHEIELDKQKDEFISIASHELKTPISVVKNNLWMLENTTKKKYSQRDTKFMTEMDYGLNRLQSIVNNLLNVSRIQQGRLTFEIQKAHIYTLTISSIEALNENAKKKGLILHKPQNIDAYVEVDPAKYQEILENFISNAIKYTPKGNVYVKIEPQTDKFYRVTVIDEGPGIPRRDYSKIFTKFGRAEEGLKIKTSEGSTGLGLYIAKQFAVQMGGEIGFSSELGKGSTFWFTVPVKSPLPPQPQPAQSVTTGTRPTK